MGFEITNLEDIVFKYKEVLRDWGFPLERFSISQENDYVVRITLNETWYSFNTFVSFFANEYEVGMYPYRPNKPYKLTTKNLSEVIENLSLWLNSIEPKLFIKTKGEILIALNFPKIELNTFEHNLLEHFYKEFLEGTHTGPLYQILARLYPNAPAGFDPKIVIKSLQEKRLISIYNQITPYGIWLIARQSEILDLLNEVILFIKNRVTTEVELSIIKCTDIERALNINSKKSNAVVRILGDLGGFMTNQNLINIDSIDINHPKVYDRYLSYSNLQELIETSIKSNNTKLELEGVKQNYSNENTKPKFLFQQNKLEIRDTLDLEPVLGVTSLANQITEIIKKLKAEPGNMIGIFGPWGRGKTFLINQVLSQINKNNKEYEIVRFHAWRYQDTPASWAYLYERFADEYLGDKRKSVANWFKYHFRLWDLNLERDGYLGLVTIIALLIISTFGIYLTEFGKRLLDGTIIKLVWFLGIPFGGFLITSFIKNINLIHFSKATNLIKKYAMKISFKDNLGIQAEIQKELIHMVRCWSKSTKRKIIIFIDDLDRCKEEKSLEIIDSLRIILDEEKIRENLLVITAIDERILKTAVSNRYHDRESSNDLQREYIDKLFIFSLRLNTLSYNESVEFFNTLVKNDKHENESDAIKAPITGGSESNSIKKDTTNVKSQKDAESNANNSDTIETNLFTNTSDQITKVQKLTQYEIDVISSQLSELKGATPRRIRILYYRYLFAKNIIIEKYSKIDANPFWLTEPNLSIFISKLIFFSQNEINLISREIDKIVRLEGNDDISLFTSKVSKNEYLNLLKVLELSIAY